MAPKKDLITLLSEEVEAAVLKGTRAYSAGYQDGYEAGVNATKKIFEQFNTPSKRKLTDDEH